MISHRKFTPLRNVPPEREWWVAFDNPNTRQAYRLAIQNFRVLANIVNSQDMRSVILVHVILLAHLVRATAIAPSTIPC